MTNLPLGVTVETLATFQQNQLAPHTSGRLPDSLLALVHKHCVTQELTVECALTGDRAKILQAMIADPLNNNNDFREINAMLDELLEANRALLPQFSPKPGARRTTLIGKNSTHWPAEGAELAVKFEGGRGSCQGC